ncbi:PfkB family carbohydrate kinase [Streptomyces sp. NPDC056159]|uniref:carbohydrate kinase family protein n=1 Tax=Streptomyces sp. NPDC056159 TaxID=3155537 RepID=UPI00343EBF5D
MVGAPHAHVDAQVDPLAGLRSADDPPWDVYLTGTVFLDIIFTGLGSAPVRGTESWARGMGSSPGGVANMATALARLGLRTSLAAAFGDDHYGDYCWDALEQGEGIDLSPSGTVPGWHSPVTVSMAYEGERTMVSHGHEPPPEAVFLQEGVPECRPRARAAVASLTPGRRSPWIAQAAGEGTRIFGDVGWDDTGAWDLAGLSDLEHCEAFLPNAEEAMRYTGTDCPRAAAHALTAFVPLAVVTLGSEGAYAVDRRTGESAEVPAIAVEALDPTGAGDVFVAGFVTGTLAGWPLADRLAFAGLTARRLRLAQGTWWSYGRPRIDPRAGRPGRRLPGPGSRRCRPRRRGWRRRGRGRTALRRGCPTWQSPAAHASGGPPCRPATAHHRPHPQPRRRP